MTSSSRSAGRVSGLSVDLTPAHGGPVGRSVRVVMYDPGAFLPYYVDRLCRGLSARGVRPRVIASRPLFEPVDSQGAYDVDNVFFRLLQGMGRRLVRHRRAARWAVKGITYPFGLLRAWVALRAGPPGVLHVQWAPVPALDALLVRAMKARQWRVVYTVHDPLPPASARFAFARHRTLLRLADALIVHTPRQSGEIIAAVPDVSGRMHIIAHGGTQVPLANEAERRRCREALDIDPDRPLLLFFGLIKPYKGVEYLLDAMPNVIAGFPTVQLVIAGEPLMPLHGLQRQIDRLDLRRHVSLRPGFVTEGDVPRYLHAADMLVAPYVSGGASGVVALAQGHALPVVVTDVGGLPEFVQRGECGFVVPPRSADALADAICRGLGDREALAAMGVRGWQRLARDNQWGDVADRTLDLYGAVAASGPRVRC